ncbi:hypothetical protein HMPREF9075_01918 [Capnocytophaga sp. oral taxon 332 str. F0381]|nr:hypothetical protein HMPREF9075_01918 [Capnocytophaga sp. oral taxon 332 str. F0381]
MIFSVLYNYLLRDKGSQKLINLKDFSLKNFILYPLPLQQKTI